jgi:hypothetical protein
MRSMIYISGILGGLLVTIGLVGAVSGFNNNTVFLISGLALIIFIYIPFLLLNKYRQTRKIKNIIKSYANKPSRHNSKSSDKSDIKAWGMNNSPFRRRKSGLSTTVLASGRSRMSPESYLRYGKGV